MLRQALTINELVESLEIAMASKREGVYIPLLHNLLALRFRDLRACKCDASAPVFCVYAFIHYSDLVCIDIDLGKNRPISWNIVGRVVFDPRDLVQEGLW